MSLIHVRLDDRGGVPMPEAQLRTVYASGLDFEPEERRIRLLQDGTVELIVEKKPYLVHAKIQVPLYGTLWVMADNLGQGYDGDFVDFVSEAVRTYLHAADTYGRDVSLSSDTQAHLLAARELTHLAERGQNTPDNRLMALSHAIYAAEGALYDRSRARIAASPRSDLMLGCCCSRFSGSNTRTDNFFLNAFDYATLPFYAGRTVPEEGKYDYSYIDRTIPALAAKKLTLKGHPLWFGHKEVNPDWLLNKDFDGLCKAAREIALHHVTAYKGVIRYWDAMNEAHDWANCFELNQDQQVKLTRILCEAVHEADPEAKAIVNVCLPFAEYVAGRYACYGALPEHLTSPLSYLRRLVKEGVPFDIVGIQLYFPARDMVAVDRLLDAYAALGKPVHITEMGVNGGAKGQGQGKSGWSQLDMSDGTWHGGWNEHTQADWLEQFYTLAATRKEIGALTWWDFIEPSFFGNGAMLYEDGTPREIYFRYLALKKRLCSAAK